MKLLYITNGINGAGGLERVLSVKASFLAERYGYEVTIVTLNEIHPNSFYTFSPKVKLKSISVGGNAFSYLSLYLKGIKYAIHEFKPDVISVCDDGLKGFFLPTLLKIKTPIIYERHASISLNTDSSIKGRVMHFLMQQQASKFSRFVVLTESNKIEWNAKNVIAISNPLSFYPQSTAELINKRIIVVGTHSYNKGYDLLLESWKTVVQNYPDWKLEVFGKIDEDKIFLNLATELKIGNSVFFYEPVANIQEKYLEASVMVLSSRSEGFGMVLIEAMACGVPCVSFDCPAGPRDIIKNNEDGFLVAKENVKQLTESIEILIANKDKRIEMGAKAKANVKRYLPENIVAQWDTLFKTIQQ